MIDERLERQVELFISWLLRTGVMVSLTLLVVGMSLMFRHHPLYRSSHTELAALTSAKGVYPHTVSAAAAAHCHAGLSRCGFRRPLRAGGRPAFRRPDDDGARSSDPIFRTRGGWRLRRRVRRKTLRESVPRVVWARRSTHRGRRSPLTAVALRVSTQSGLDAGVSSFALRMAAGALAGRRVSSSGSVVTAVSSNALVNRHRRRKLSSHGMAAPSSRSARRLVGKAATSGCTNSIGGRARGRRSRRRMG